MKKSLIASVAAIAMLSNVLVAFAGSNTAGPSTTSPVGTALGSATLWAAINANGTIARSDGAEASKTFKIAGFNGSYQINFFRNVTGCVYVATIGNAGAGNPLHGSLVVAQRAGLPSGVFVETRDTSGNLADRPFHLFVNC
jgi:hypothetical protein